jgi:hypothetical protein
MEIRSLEIRAMKCPSWRWMAGMVTRSEVRVTRAVGSRIVGVLDPAYHEVGLDADDQPDFTDSATLGCLLFLVREAWSDPRIGVRGYIDEPGDPIYYAVEPLDVEITGDTEAEALVRALEAVGVKSERA